MPPLRSILLVGTAESVRLDRLSALPTLDIAWARDVDDALALPLGAFDAVVLDLGTAEASRDGVRRLVARAGPGLPPVLSLLGSGDPGVVVGEGADEVLLLGDLPGESERLAELLHRLDHLAEIARSARALGRDPLPPPVGPRAGRFGIVARSRAMEDLLALAERAMASNATVLIHGETGTGKELLARAIHEGSRRSGKPFVALNCAAFPETLLESELFGSVRGAFTGADRDRPGLFVEADGGTLFLDEVAETSTALQAKLLRVLQEREVRPVGGTRPRRVDVRLVAATHRHLRREVAAGRFREDLFYRLAVFPLDLPPLRERPEDIAPLVEHFLERHGRREGRPGCRLSPAAMRALLGYPWPGNVRELENEVQRLLALAEPGGTLGVDALAPHIRGEVEACEARCAPGETLRESLDRMEAWLIRRALDAQGGHRTRTARALGITREGLWKKMRRLRIE